MKSSEYQFKHPYIKESLFRINEGFKQTEPGNINIVTRTNQYTSYKEGQSQNSAICGLTIQIGEVSENAPFFAKVTMEAKFSWENKTEEEISNFMKVNVPTLLTGYIRPIITFLTANSPYPPFDLGFINFTE